MLQNEIELIAILHSQQDAERALTTATFILADCLAKQAKKQEGHPDPHQKGA